MKKPPAINETIPKSKYNLLLKDLKNLIESSRQIVESGADKKITTTYWQVGKRIAKESISTKNNYQNSILRDLGNELGIEKTTLSRCINFFKIYPKLPKDQPLSWSHYRQLLAIKDEKIRSNLEAQTTKHKWSRDQLASAIKKLNNPNQSNQKTILKRPTTPTYLYKAKVVEVIDGDTLILNIDLGFQIHKEQRIRLACIDAPEINTKKGKASYQFLRDKLTNLDYIMIKTQKVDIYGRFLGHIFYNPTGNLDNDEIFKNGVYLNEEILEKGFGVEM